MGFLKLWRVLGALCGLVYASFGYIAQLEGSKFNVALDCLVAALYFFGTGKAHSSLNRRRGRL